MEYVRIIGKVENKSMLQFTVQLEFLETAIFLANELSYFCLLNFWTNFANHVTIKCTKNYSRVENSVVHQPRPVETAKLQLPITARFLTNFFLGITVTDSNFLSSMF